MAAAAAALAAHGVLLQLYFCPLCLNCTLRSSLAVVSEPWTVLFMSETYWTHTVQQLPVVITSHRTYIEREKYRVVKKCTLVPQSVKITNLPFLFWQICALDSFNEMFLTKELRFTSCLQCK